MGKRLSVLGPVAVVFLVFGAPASAVRGDRAVRTVLASQQSLRYFPGHVGTSSCRIPFVFRRIEGICTARVAARAGNSGQVFVNLSERWQWREFHYSGTPRRRLHHHWVFDVLPSGKVVLVRQTGDFPPNYAR